MTTEPCEATSRREAVVAAFHEALSQLDRHLGGFPRYGGIDIDFGPQAVISNVTIKNRLEVRVRMCPRPKLDIE